MGLLMFREPKAASPKSALKADPTASARSAIRRVPLSSPPVHSRRTSDGTQRRTALDAMGNLVELSSLPPRSPLIRVFPPGFTNPPIAGGEAEQRSPERSVPSNLHPEDPGDSAEDFLDAPEDVVSLRRPTSGSDSEGTRRRRRAAHRADSLERARLRHERRARRSDPNARSAVQPFSAEGAEEGDPRPGQATTRHQQELYADQVRRFLPRGPEPGFGGPRRRDWRPIHMDPNGRLRVGSPGEAVAPRLTIYNADGLGDRHRSLSPEESAWDTLLSTIQPDEHLPSATSSFASASATASSAPASQGSRTSSEQRSARSSARSSATSLSRPASTTPAHISQPSSDPYAVYVCDDAADAVPPFSNSGVRSSGGTTTNNNHNNNHSPHPFPPPLRDWTGQHYYQQPSQADIRLQELRLIENNRPRAADGTPLYWHSGRPLPEPRSMHPANHNESAAATRTTTTNRHSWTDRFNWDPPASR